MIEYSPEELERFVTNNSILDQIFSAIDRGDHDEETALRKNLVVPAETLLSLLEMSGPEWLIEKDWNTSEAERVFGPDWMNMEIAALKAINDAR